MQKLPAALSQMEKHKGPLIECNCADTPNPAHTQTHTKHTHTVPYNHLPQITELHPHTFRALQCSFWFIFMESSHSLIRQLNPVFATEMGAKNPASLGGEVLVGGVLFFWWEPSNVIKIHGGVFN